MIEQLKPCPFCGGEADIMTPEADNMRFATVMCMGCYVTGKGCEIIAEAVEAWNARAAIAAMRNDAAMDRLVAEGQRCDAMTPQDDRSLPGRIMVWHSSPTLNHLGTWATTRYPDDAVAYVPESLEAPTAVLDETSPRAAIGEIGNQMHNLACEFQSNEDLAERLGGFACELWRVAQSASSEPIPTMTPQEAAKVSAEDRENIVDEIESIICETHEMDVRDIDYAENIVSWLERHHPAALRAISEDSQ